MDAAEADRLASQALVKKEECQQQMSRARDEQNRNWFYFNLSFESLSFIFNNFKTEKLKLTFEG